MSGRASIPAEGWGAKSVSYDASGWAVFERCSAELVQKWGQWNAPWDVVLDLGHPRPRTAEAEPEAEAPEAGGGGARVSLPLPEWSVPAAVEADAAHGDAAPRRWPVSPDAFDDRCGSLSFGADAGGKAAATRLYRDLATHRLGGLRWLSPGLATGLPRPTASDGASLGGCLGHANALVYLDLMLVGLGSAAFVAMCGALRERALPQLTTLRLAGCAIGDDGLAALATCLISGKRMPKLKVLDLSGGDDDGAEPVAPDRGSIGDAGVTSLANAIEMGALSACRTLSLHRNSIGDAGMRALSGALYAGGAPKLLTIALEGNDATAAGATEMVKVCAARGIAEDLREEYGEKAEAAAEAVERAKEGAPAAAA